MNTMELVRFVSTGDRPNRSPASTSTPSHYRALIRPVRTAIVRARQFLLSEQRNDGSWHGAQTCDASLASQLILMQAYLGPERTTVVEQTAATILEQQLPSGGWPLVPDGPPDLSTSVQAYFALKLSGLDPSDERLRRARLNIRELGGADAADTVTRFFLALLGQINYDCCPAILPERLLGGRVSSWLGSRLAEVRRAPSAVNSRTFSTDSTLGTECANERCFAALALIWSHRAVRDVGMELGVRELFINKSSDWPMPTSGVVTPVAVKNTQRWRKFAALPRFVVSKIVRQFERYGWTPLRRMALQRAESLLRRNLEGTRVGQLNFSELVWHTIAIHAVGCRDDAHELKTCNRRLRELACFDDEVHSFRPRLRPTSITDTLAALYSLGASGVVIDHPCAIAAAQWLRNQHRRNNRPIPVLDLVAMLQTMRIAAAGAGRDSQETLPPQLQMSQRRSHRIRRRDKWWPASLGRAAARLFRRLLREQNADGGWSATGHSKSAPDVTALVLEALAAHDGHAVSPALDRAVEFLRAAQRADGSWDSVTGVRLVHGTALAVRGLLAAGASPDDDCVAAGMNWLLVHQHPSGGWGETARTSTELGRDEFMAGPATASQTAWALLALVAAGRANDVAVRRGIDFLLETQDEDGRWNEQQFLLHDPVACRWLNNDLQAVIHSLVALSRWALAAGANHEHDTDRVTLRLVGATVGD